MKLQSEHRVGDSTASIWNSDSVSLLKSIKPATVDLIITSPPYFIGKEYDSSKCKDDFIREIKRIKRWAIRALKPGGSLCWQVGNHIKDGALTPLDAIIASEFFNNSELVLRNRIIWTFNHGVHASMRFSGRHETILWYTKGDVTTFNLDDVRVPQIYPGKRHYKGPRKGEWSGNPLGKNPGDVWDIGDIWGIPNVKANHVEKTEHPCQFPTALVRRLVVALSPPGGLVVDPYSGSATTAVASLVEGRSFIGSEIDRKYLEIAESRLRNLEDGNLQIREDTPVQVPSGKDSVSIRPPHFAFT